MKLSSLMDKEDGSSGKERTKTVEAVAKHLRFNVITKSAQIKGRRVDYFPGSKAVDSLMASKWNKQPADLDSVTPYFSTRQAATDFCTLLLRQHFFIRLKKVDVIPKGESPAGDEKEGEGLRKRKVTDSPRAKKSESGDSDGKKRKRKFRLEVHEQQTFIDSPEEIYYWEYDPPNKTTYIIGFFIVVGAVALTLQPLWPASTRAYVWYGSMGLLGVMGFLVCLIIAWLLWWESKGVVGFYMTTSARWFVFGLVQVFTVGKLHFWVLPNLDNEKCGFFESFQPFYSIEWKKDKSKKKSKKSTDKDSPEENQNGEKDQTLEDS